jgi:signal peptide peptidase SppA
MRFLTNALKGREPLLISPSRAADHSDLAAKAGAIEETLKLIFGSKPEAYKAGKVGVIPLRGVIGKGLSRLESLTGAADVDEFTSALEMMEDDPEVETILVDISSPGGTVTGVEEAAAALARSSKPTVAFTDTEAASAAYWIGSAADRFVATPSATVGSVGVYMAIPDYSKAFEMEGVRMDVIKSGTLKGAGIPGTSLTDAQRADLQAQVEEIHADFKASVLGKRSMVADEDMEGQVFSGRTAARKGLVTGLGTNLAALIADLNS